MSLPDLSSTPRTELGRHRERGRTDRDDLYAVLDAGLICHLGVIVNGVPRVLPTGYGRLGDLLYLHGSSANSSIMAGYGQEVCVTVTHLDGLVCARSVFNHSMNYRSAMVFGVARLVTEPAEQILALRTITEHLAPGQWSYARQPTKKELAATSALALPDLHRGLGEDPGGRAVGRAGGLRAGHLGGRGPGDHGVRGTRTGRRPGARDGGPAAHHQAGRIKPDCPCRSAPAARLATHSRRGHRL